MNIDGFMTNIIIPAKNQIRTGFSQFGHILLERFKPNHLKSLTFISARTRRMINTHHRQVAKIRTDKTPFVIILFDTHPIFDVVGLDFGQYGHSAIPFLLCRVKICFISKRLECLCRILVGLQFGFLQTKHIGILFCQPFGQPFIHRGTKSVHVISYNFHRLYFMRTTTWYSIQSLSQQWHKAQTCSICCLHNLPSPYAKRSDLPVRKR